MWSGPLVVASMWGVTTPCVTRAREHLETLAYDVLVFHQTGTGGGSMEEHCEVAEDRPCAWQLIYKRLKAIGQLDNLDAIVPPKDWSTAWCAGARKIVRQEHRV